MLLKILSLQQKRDHLKGLYLKSNWQNFDVPGITSRVIVDEAGDIFDIVIDLETTSEPMSEFGSKLGENPGKPINKIRFSYRDRYSTSYCYGDAIMPMKEEDRAYLNQALGNMQRYLIQLASDLRK
ncbi:MAG: hypothetical protein Q9M91_05865 [Candidatus Dojkabacteria bacterium]|nr:hypothetical protein [Candidatus Dojkabacteria bacterium]